MLDIATMTLIPHNPDYDSRTQLPVNYDPNAISELWIKFLRDIFPDDRDDSKKILLQQYFGYCLLRDTRYQKALFCLGTGANGKSTVIKVLTGMVGLENTSSLTLTDLSNRFRTYFLQHKLVNLSSETNTKEPLTMEIFKAAVAGDVMLAENKFTPAFQFAPYAKWVVSMNDAPVVADKSYGFERRIITLMFNRRFETHEIIDRMDEKLLEEVEGIFNWAVEGLKVILRRNGFFIGDQVIDDTSRLMEVLNPLLIFGKECFEVHEGIEEIPMQLYRAYNAWCAEGKNRGLGKNKFYEQILQTWTLVRRGQKKILTEDGSTTMADVFKNIRLTSTGRDYAKQGANHGNERF